METVGSKEKFWFDLDSAAFLFKWGRQDQGEDWAEVLADSCAELLGLPHCHYELAEWDGLLGAVTPKITTKGIDLVLGNQLLTQRDPGYPGAQGSQFVRVPQHTVDAIVAVVGADGVGLPRDWTPPPGVQAPLAVFGGYLILDAWIGNTDRHHLNWGFLVDPVKGTQRLAPTFDHASSLGAHELDSVREERLRSSDSGYTVEAYVRRAQSKIFRNKADKKPMSPLDAARVFSEKADCGPWYDRLQRASQHWIAEQIARVPPARMSGPARAFAQAMLSANRERILEG